MTGEENPFNPKTPDKPWGEVAKLDYRYKGKTLERTVPRKLLGLDGNSIAFDFHWCGALNGQGLW